MTRKDYEMIAISIFVDREYLDEKGKGTTDFIVKGLCEQFEAMNPRFDRNKFLTLCGYGEK